MRVVFTPAAERQIDKLHAYIVEQSSAERADSYIARIIEYCNGLAMFPERGARRDDLLAGLRVVGFERRVTVAFVVTAAAVLIEGISMVGGISRPSSAARRDRQCRKKALLFERRSNDLCELTPKLRQHDAKMKKSFGSFLQKRTASFFPTPADKAA